MTESQVIALFGKRVRFMDPKMGVDRFGMVVGHDPKPSRDHRENNWILISPDDDKKGPFIPVLEAEVVE